MKTHHPSLIVSAVAASLLLGTAPVLAQGSSSGNDQGKQSAQQSAQKSLQKDAEKHWEATHRASKIIGSDVQNAKGEKLGTVKDLVLADPASGRISQVVVAIGGVGGMGDKLFALPYSDLQPAPDKNALVLSSNSDLSRGFDGKNWSDIAKQDNGGSSGQANASGGQSGSSGQSASSGGSSAGATSGGSPSSTASSGQDRSTVSSTQGSSEPSSSASSGSPGSASNTSSGSANGGTSNPTSNPATAQ